MFISTFAKIRASFVKPQPCLLNVKAVFNGLMEIWWFWRNDPPPKKKRKKKNKYINKSSQQIWRMVRHRYVVDTVNNSCHLCTKTFRIHFVKRIHQLTVKTVTVAVECNKYQVKLGTNLTYYTTPTHSNLPLLSPNQLSPMISLMII